MEAPALRLKRVQSRRGEGRNTEFPTNYIISDKSWLPRKGEECSCLELLQPKIVSHRPERPPGCAAYMRIARRKNTLLYRKCGTVCK